MGAGWDPGPTLGGGAARPASPVSAGAAPLLGAAQPASPARAGAAPLLGAAPPASPPAAGVAASRATWPTLELLLFPPLELLLLLLLRRVLLHSLVKRYRAEEGDLEKVKDILANHRAFPWFAQLSVVSDKPSHRMTDTQAWCPT